MKKIRIEETGNINNEYRNLEVFFNDSKEYFLYIGINESKELFFEFNSTQKINLSIGQLSEILETAKNFLPQALKDEEDFNESIT